MARAASTRPPPTDGGTAPSRPRRRMFWRVYFYGLLLLLTVVVGVGVSAYLFDSHMPIWEISDRMARLVAQDLQAARQDPGRLERRLREIQYLLDGSVAVYHPDGRRIAARGPSPPPPLDPEDQRTLIGHGFFHRHGVGLLLAVPLESAPGKGPYLVLVHKHRGHEGLVKLTATLGVILLLLALAALPMARTITRPLERIAETARALGQGDLSARSGLQRTDELGALAAVLDEMAARLQHRMHADRELWANISHELRTPLARIRVALELCQEEQGSVEALHAHLSGIATDISELDRLINDVLLSARLDLGQNGGEAGGLVLRRQDVDLRALVQEAASRFSGFSPGRKLELQVQADLPSVQADPALLHRVLGNLLANGAKYSEPDTTLQIRAAAGEGEVVVEVSDRGIGVPEQDLPHLFDHFFRTDRSRSRGAGGVGLGLTLCKRIVEAHGGSIEAGARAGGGTTIRFSLPAPERGP